MSLLIPPAASRAAFMSSTASLLPSSTQGGSRRRCTVMGRIASRYVPPTSLMLIVGGLSEPAIGLARARRRCCWRTPRCHRAGEWSASTYGVTIGNPIDAAAGPSRPGSCLQIMQALCRLCLLNSRQRKTLAAIFTDPVSGTIEWAAVESLLLAAGTRLIEGRGSRVRFEKDGEIETFHRPHPTKEARRYQVRAARAFLQRIGVTP